MAKPTGITGLSGQTDKLPTDAIMTDDPMRAKMMAAHWLEDASVLYEQRGMIGYTGSYKGTNIALLSAGFGETSATLYLHDAALLGVSRVIYVGECIAYAPGIRLRDIILADGGDIELSKRAIAAAEQFSISISAQNVTTCDRLALGNADNVGDIADFASGAIAAYASEHKIAALSILTVSQNESTKERMEEHERQSRFNAASRLAFETLAVTVQYV